MDVAGVYCQRISPEKAVCTIQNDGKKITKNYEIYSHDDLPILGRFIDNRSVVRTLADKLLAPCREIFFILQTIRTRILIAAYPERFPEYCQPSAPKTWKNWKENSTGLHLFTHGFKGSPAIWNVYVEVLRAKDPTSDIRVPYAPQNCSLESSTKPVREILKTYINDQVEKKENTIIPINLYGVSNGTRITLELLQGLIDPELRQKLSQKHIQLAFKVNCIAGVLRGTTTWSLRLANCCRLIKWIAQNILRISPHILSDFTYKSAATTQLIEKTKALKDSQTDTYEFSFYASTEDNKVTPYTSSLPVLGKNETHCIVHGEYHDSVVKRVMPLILKS